MENTRTEFKAQAANIRKRVEEDFGHKKNPFVAFVKDQEKRVQHGEKRAYYEARDMAIEADAVLYELNWDSSALKKINELMAAALFQAYYGFAARKTVAPSHEEPFTPDLVKRASKLEKGNNRDFDETLEMDREESPIMEESEFYNLDYDQGTRQRGGFRRGFRGGPRGNFQGRGRGGHWRGRGKYPF